MATIRFTTEPVTIGGTAIAADQIILISPATPPATKTPPPLTYNATPPATSPSAAASTTASAPASPRAETEIALANLMQRFPDLRLTAKAEDLRWCRSRLFRSLEALRVRW